MRGTFVVPAVTTLFAAATLVASVPRPALAQSDASRETLQAEADRLEDSSRSAEAFSNNTSFEGLALAPDNPIGADPDGATAMSVDARIKDETANVLQIDPADINVSPPSLDPSVMNASTDKALQAITASRAAVGAVQQIIGPDGQRLSPSDMRSLMADDGAIAAAEAAGDLPK
ncbi:hypothetical protein [Mongoliimonas terrestris]|uniref:hypothetical protein n=1 Tax=Mongoliimonas terrestris TaxID=1709001 RepID=UPI0009498501|nr:hypothetical protein [Mongoliimonas terrestris]